MVRLAVKLYLGILWQKQLPSMFPVTHERNSTDTVIYFAGHDFVMRSREVQRVGHFSSLYVSGCRTHARTIRLLLYLAFRFYASTSTQTFFFPRFKSATPFSKSSANNLCVSSGTTSPFKLTALSLRKSRASRFELASLVLTSASTMGVP